MHPIKLNLAFLFPFILSGLLIPSGCADHTDSDHTDSQADAAHPPAAAGSADTVLPAASFRSIDTAHSSTSGHDTASTHNTFVAHPGPKESDDPEPDLKTVLTGYYKECRDTIRLDTSIYYKGTKLDIAFLHYCTHDSMINIPYKYIKTWGLKKFVAHDFESSLRIRNRQHTLLDTIIRNDIFNPYVDENLISYGTLFYSGISFLPDKIRFDYSYSIALTDIGVLVHLDYLYSGKLKAENEYH